MQNSDIVFTKPLSLTLENLPGVYALLCMALAPPSLAPPTSGPLRALSLPPPLCDLRGPLPQELTPPSSGSPYSTDLRTGACPFLWAHCTPHDGMAPEFPMGAPRLAQGAKQAQLPADLPPAVTKAS